MFESTKNKDKLTVIVEHDGEQTIIRPACEMSWLDRILGALRCKPCTGDLVVNAGIADLAAYVRDNYTIAAYGTGTTAPAKTQTSLVAEVDRKAVETATVITTTAPNDTAHFEVTFTLAADAVVTEFAMFKSDGVTMLCRQLTGPLTLRAGNKVTFIEDIQES